VPTKLGAEPEPRAVLMHGGVEKISHVPLHANPIARESSVPCRHIASALQSRMVDLLAGACQGIPAFEEAEASRGILRRRDNLLFGTAAARRVGGGTGCSDDACGV
jgi:hypothetical protein